MNKQKLEAILNTVAAALSMQLQSIIDNGFARTKEEFGLTPDLDIGYVLVVRSGEASVSLTGGHASLTDQDMIDAMTQTAASLKARRTDRNPKPTLEKVLELLRDLGK